MVHLFVCIHFLMNSCVGSITKELLLEVEEVLYRKSYYNYNYMQQSGTVSSLSATI